MAAMRNLVAHATPGTSLSFGLESADPRVTEANNLNIDADGCLEAIRMVNAIGRDRGENSENHTFYNGTVAIAAFYRSVFQ